MYKFYLKADFQKYFCGT